MLRRSADKNYPLSYYYLGQLYKEGKGVGKDDEKAFFCFKLASDNQIAHAKYELALLYRDGIGTERDIKIARKLLLEAQRLGVVEAEDALKTL